MVLPKPGHGIRILSETLVQSERTPSSIDRERRAAGRIDPDAYNVIRLEPAHRALCRRQRLFQRDLGADDIFHGMLPCQVWIARQDYTFSTLRVVPDRCRDLPSIRDVYD